MDGRKSSHITKNSKVNQKIQKQNSNIQNLKLGQKSSDQQMKNL